MRLINVNTFELEDFVAACPPYAILSHTWGDEEVSFKEWEEDWDSARSKRGYSKIYHACKKTKEDDLQYLWVDTNCIDKSNSTELSEAINSMFAWYGNSEICYAYLEDFVLPNTIDVGEPINMTEPRHTRLFWGSQWFTRGWTLQELLAPCRVRFFTADWRFIGDRDNVHICRLISGASGIETQYLLRAKTKDEQLLRVHKASIGKRMSWMADRTTTRVEDMAYCMLGLFNIHMPLLYGEGAKAFLRLQEQLIREYNDHTIFLWGFQRAAGSQVPGILASEPADFKNCGRFQVLTRNMRKIVFGDRPNILPYAISNIGLTITLPVLYGTFGLFGFLNAQTMANPLASSDGSRIGLALEITYQFAGKSSEETYQPSTSTTRFLLLECDQVERLCQPMEVNLGVQQYNTIRLGKQFEGLRLDTQQQHPLAKWGRMDPSCLTITFNARVWGQDQDDLQYAVCHGMLVGRNHSMVYLEPSATAGAALMILSSSAGQLLLFIAASRSKVPEDDSPSTPTLSDYNLPASDMDDETLSLSSRSDDGNVSADEPESQHGYNAPQWYAEAVEIGNDDEDSSGTSTNSLDRYALPPAYRGQTDYDLRFQHQCDISGRRQAVLEEAFALWRDGSRSFQHEQPDTIIAPVQVLLSTTRPSSGPLSAEEWISNVAFVVLGPGETKSSFDYDTKSRHDIDTSGPVHPSKGFLQHSVARQLRRWR